MSDKNQFGFEDDEFRFDDDGDFNLGDEDLPPGLEDEDELPELDELEEERGGPNRTFVVLAGLMIVLFLVGMGVVLVLAAQNSGPTAAELTTTAIYATNSAVEVALNQTQTQSALDAALTATALAFTATPSPEPTGTRPPTLTPTATLDATQLAATQLAEQANAAATAAYLSTLAAEAARSAANASLQDLFATQVQFETRQAVVVQSIYETQVALATQGVVLGEVLTQVAGQTNATQAALISELEFVRQANARLEQAFATRLPQGGEFSTLVAVGTPAAFLTQMALATPQAAATISGRATADFFQTQIAEQLEAVNSETDLQAEVMLDQRSALIEAVVAQLRASDPAAADPLATDLAQNFATAVAYNTQQALVPPSGDLAAYGTAIQSMDDVFATFAAQGGPIATLAADLLGSQETAYVSPVDQAAMLIGQVLFPVYPASAAGNDAPAQQDDVSDAFATQVALEQRSILIDQLLTYLLSAPPLDVEQVAPLATSIASNFGTEVAITTQQADAAINATLTVVAAGDDAAATEAALSFQATQAALQEQANSVATVAAGDNITLSTRIAQFPDLGTALAPMLPGGTTPEAPPPATLVPENQAAVETLAAIQTQVSQLEDLSGLEAFATQSAFLTPQAISTAAAVATQAALAARAELIRQALILEIVQDATEAAQTQPAISADAVALTATSLALTLAPPPTQEGFGTPAPTFVPMPTALPETGLFDDVFTGGREGLGWILLVGIGLVGVIAASRRLRASNNRRDE